MLVRCNAPSIVAGEATRMDELWGTFCYRLLKTA